VPSWTRVGQGVLPARLVLRITIDRELVIVDAEAASDAVPYPGYCDTIAPAYKQLIGLCLMKGFRAGLKRIDATPSLEFMLDDLDQIVDARAAR